MRLASLAWEYFGGFLPTKEDAADEVLVWFVNLIQVFVPAVDHLDQLMPKSLFLFGFDVEQAREREDNAAILAVDSARTVLGEFASHVRAHQDRVTPEVFKSWMEEIKDATGIKGQELYHPIRVALTGTHSGPDFDKIIPLIENGKAVGLDVPTVQQRIEKFVGV